MADETPTTPRGTIECPECQQPVTREGAIAHSLTHWPHVILPYPEHMEAIKRQAILRDHSGSGQR